MRKLLAIGLLFMFPATSFAQPWYKKKSFWVGELVIGTAVFLDYQSTARNHAAGESNPTFNRILGSNPSYGKVAGVGVAAFVWESGLNVAANTVVRNDPNKYWRFAGKASIPAVSFAIHVPAAIHNYQLK